MRPGENEGGEKQWGSFLAQESIMDPLKQDAVLSFFVEICTRYVIINLIKKNRTTMAQMSRRAKAKQPSKAPGQYGGTQKSDDAFRNAVVGRVSKELLLSMKTRWEE